MANASYPLKKGRNIWNNAEERDLVIHVRRRFDSMRQGKQTSCPFPTLKSDRTKNSRADKSTGGNWVDLWNESLKQYYMWGEKTKGRSNIKLPTTYSVVEAIVAEFSESELLPLLTARDNDDAVRAAVQEQFCADLYSRQDFHSVDIETARMTGAIGSGIQYIGYQEISRPVTLLLQGEDLQKALDKKEFTKKDIKERLDAGLPIEKKDTLIEYKDIVKINVDPFAFFVDETARCMIGPAYAANDCIWRMTPSVDEVQRIYNNSSDPYIIKQNLKKVKTAELAQQNYSDTSPFFRAPGDLMGTDRVELLHYYCKDDTYAVIANDVVIRKGPLPYNHKQLPFTLHRFITIYNQFWGLGIGYILRNPQAAMEALLNMRVEQEKINTSRPMFYNSAVFPDMAERIEPGTQIPGNSTVGQENIRWMDPYQTGAEYFKVMDLLQSIAIQATGVNPILFAMPQQDEAVRNNMMVVESSMKFIKKAVKSYAVGTKQGYRQILSLAKQFIAAELAETEEDMGPDPAYTTVVLRNMDIKKGDNGKMTIQKVDGEHTVKLDPDFFNVTHDLDIRLDIDNIVPLSKAVKLNKLNQALQTIIPLLQANLNSLPGINDLIVEYLRELGITADVIRQFQQESNDDQKERADIQEQAILQGLVVPSVPGESNIHILCHSMRIIDEMTQITQAEQKGKDMTKQKMALAALITHLKGDMVPKDKAPMVSAQQGDAMMQPPQPQVPPMMQPPQQMQQQMQNNSPDQLLQAMAAGGGALPNMGGELNATDTAR